MSPAAELRGATPPVPAEVLSAVRTAVRGVLESAPGFVAADPALRRSVAEKMVNVSMMAADLLHEDLHLSKQAASRPRALATAQAASDTFNPTSAKSAAGVLEATKKAIDFPTFVTSLINGVFQSITGSTLHQLESFADLLDNVAASGESFASNNVRDADVMRWAAGKFSFVAPAPDGAGLAVREGADLSSHAKELKEGLEATAEEIASIDEGDLAATLLPLCKRKMGRDRQAILATMVQFGLQRVVVDEGRLHASMDMRVDTRSVAEQNTQDRQDLSVGADVSASVGVGPWAASAHVATNYSQIHADQQYSKEEMALRAGLRSSVDLAFRTEQIPLDRMANDKARVKLDLAARVPASVGDAGLLPTEHNITPVALTPAAPIAAAPPPKQAEAKKGNEEGAEKQQASKKKDAGEGEAGAKKKGAKKDAAKNDAVKDDAAKNGAAKEGAAKKPSGAQKSESTEKSEAAS